MFLYSFYYTKAYEQNTYNFMNNVIIVFALHETFVSEYLLLLVKRAQVNVEKMTEKE